MRFARSWAVFGRAPSGERQKPAGDSATTAEAPPSRPHSIATHDPREIPATPGRERRPRDSENSITADARLRAVGSTSLGSSGERPKPGMSIAITSR